MYGCYRLLSQARDTFGSIRLSDWIDRPAIIEQNNQENFLYLTLGLATQAQELTDDEFDPEVKDFLFRRDQETGTDLKAIDIQRARDHGMGSYNDLRYFCGLPQASSWNGYLDHITPDRVAALRRIYRSYEDVELTVGGALETHVDGSLAGPTFMCIMTKQFYRTRHGDRYFFENCNGSGFTRSE